MLKKKPPFRVIRVKWNSGPLHKL